MGEPWTLVVGGSGRVGRLLRPHAPPGWRWQARQAPADVVWSPLDGPAPLRAACALNGPPAAMIVLAGVTAGPDVGMNQAIAVACAEAAAVAGVPRVLLASSSAVYGPGGERPLREEDPLAPVNDYGRAKVAMEVAVARFPAVCCLRIGNVAGADMLLRNAAAAVPGEPLTLDAFPDGASPTRSYIGAATMVRVLDALVRAPDLPAALNVAAPEPVSMASLLAANGTPFVTRDAPATALRRVTLDVSRLQRLVEFVAEDSSPEAMVRQWRASGGTG